jgi:hypothetical protein
MVFAGDDVELSIFRITTSKKPCGIDASMGLGDG